MTTTYLATDDAFYVSGTFWLTAVLVAMTAVLIGIGWKVTKRKVRWETNITRILSNDHRLAKDLRVTWQGEGLTAPMLATIRLTNYGRRDIPSGTFDGKRPISIAFSTRIVTLIEPALVDQNSLVPIKKTGNTIMIGPGLIKAGGTITVVALIDGISKLKGEFPLKDVSVVEGAKEFGLPVSRTARIVLISYGIFSVLALATLPWWVPILRDFVHQPAQDRTDSVTVPTETVTTTVSVTG